MATKVEDELRDLQLIQTRFEVNRLRGQENQRTIRAQSVERSLRNEIARDARTAAGCTHKKGGKGIEMLHRGNDSNYAVVKHQLPHGPIIVICMRCPKVWEQPDPALIARGATAEMRSQYKRELRDYNEALNFPTDNEMSGSQLFVVTREAPLLAEAV